MMLERGRDRIVVIGFGNTLRGDDGVGRRVADTIAREGLAHVTVISTTQLMPELAAEVAWARGVVFVDACYDDLPSVQVSEIEAAASESRHSHELGPSALLGLAGQCFGGAPRAWLVAVPASEFGLTDELSSTALSGVGSAVSLVKALIRNELRNEVAHA